MIFQHTWESVIASAKTQTSRLWKNNWALHGLHNDKMEMVWDILYAIDKTGNSRKQYYVGQILSVQPARGAKGIAKIRVLELNKRDVRNFNEDDFSREGLDYRLFWELWTSMHDKPYFKEYKVRGFGTWIQELNLQPAENYTALVMRFELAKD